MGQKVTKRQHYIPRFILRNYAIPGDEKRIYRYDVRAKYEKRISIADVCVESNLYEKKDAAGKVDRNYLNVSEKRLGCLETIFSFAVKKALNNQPLSHNEQCKLVATMIIQLLRMPGTMKDNSEIIARYFNLPTWRADNIVKKLSFDYMARQDSNHALLSIFTDDFSNHKLKIWKSNSTKFILSNDTPVIGIPCLGISQQQEMNLYFPVSPDTCISLLYQSNSNEQYEVLDAECCRYLNLIAFEKCSSYLYGNVPIAKQIQKYDFVKSITQGHFK